MSLLSWKAEFYEQPASEFRDRTDRACCVHSLTKWRGLLPENLKKHEVVVFKGVLSEEPSKLPNLGIDGYSCALCVKRYSTHKGCIACPIYKAAGFSCEGIWRSFVHQPEPNVPKMISLLETTLAWLESPLDTD